MPEKQYNGKIFYLPEIPERNSCKNCDNRRWGSEEGYDKCDLHLQTIGWSEIDKIICDSHERTKFTDPRNRTEKICTKCSEKTHGNRKLFCSQCGVKFILMSEI